MLSKIQIYSLIGSTLYLLLILWNVRKRRITEAYALLWILSALLMMALSIWTDCLNKISALIGIYYPPATLFLFLQGCMILVLLQYSILLSRNQQRVSRLTQEIALLKNEIEALKTKK